MRRYWHMKSPSGDLIPFTTYNGRVTEKSVAFFPEDVRDLAPVWAIFSLKKELAKRGYVVTPNQWCGDIIINKVDGGYIASCVAKHKVAGLQKTLRQDVPSESLQDCKNQFWESWNRAMETEYDGLGIHTHLVFDYKVEG